MIEAVPTFDHKITVIVPTKDNHKKSLRKEVKAIRLAFTEVVGGGSEYQGKGFWKHLGRLYFDTHVALTACCTEEQAHTIIDLLAPTWAVQLRQIELFIELSGPAGVKAYFVKGDEAA